MPLSVNSILSDHSLEPRTASSVVSGRQFEQALTQTAAQRTQAKRTHLTASAASAELRNAWTHVTGEIPDDTTVAVLTAQWAHETAHGAAMYNYNFGGIKGVGPTGLSVEQRTKEGSGRNERQITDRFRAYESPQAGAEDYVKLLMHRYPEAVNAARKGDSEGFVQSLKQRGYFTGDMRAYQHSVSSLSKELLANEFRDIPSQAGQSIVSPTSNAGTAAGSEGTVASLRAVRGGANGSHLSLIRPLTPSILLNALSSNSLTASELNVFDDKASIASVSVQSMVDEVLRATLQFATSDSDANGRSGNVG
jgi:flagellum-specific peptidoglycan hydrolase FlgJ